MPRLLAMVGHLGGIGPKTRFLYRDPFVIPVVDELVERYSLGDAGPGYQCHYHYPFRIRLLEELQFLIWDFLDRADVDVLHQEFTGESQWTMPDTYWVSRAEKINDHIRDPRFILRGEKKA